MTALVAELGEFLQEVQWKTWITERGGVNRDQAVGELVDVAHFLANLANALGVTDEEWEARYIAKQARNAERQRDGYDGTSGKCVDCHRDLRETELIEIRESVGANGQVTKLACQCGRVLP